jgi:hypothetical protein
MKKVLILILVWFIVASFFYAAIWTNEKNTLSECFIFTGFVAIGQIMLTCISYPVVVD